jgi:hypothetical protein
MPSGRFSGGVRTITILVLPPIAILAQGQRRTIPQQLAEERQSLVHLIGVGDGTLGDPKSDEYFRRYRDRLLGETERVVRGRVGRPAPSYLSDDQMEIYTDYPIDEPLVLYDRDTTNSSKRSSALTLTLLGGTVTINGLTFTSDHESLQRLQPGSDVLLLLKRVGSRYFIADRYEGAFSIQEGKLVPLHKGAWGVPPAYTEARADRVISQMLAWLRQRRR